MLGRVLGRENTFWVEKMGEIPLDVTKLTVILGRENSIRCYKTDYVTYKTKRISINRLGENKKAEGRR